MNQTYKEVNKYLAVNSVGKSIIPSFPDKKSQVPFKVSNKELAEESYRWDPSAYRFIKIER
jgi:hypothetical protein